MKYRPTGSVVLGEKSLKEEVLHRKLNLIERMDQPEVSTACRNCTTKNKINFKRGTKCFLKLCF